MILDRPALVRIGQAVASCYRADFLEHPERVQLSGTHQQVIWGTDRDGPRPYGVVYQDEKLEAWIVCLRGTDSTAEWFEDATAFLVDCPFLPGARTHAGFTALYESLRCDKQPLRDYLAGLTRPIIVTGHSLGAALATLVAVAIGGADLVTFAGPRCGNEAWAEMAATRLASNARVVNIADMVPKLPAFLSPEFPYTHVGAALEFDSASQVKDDPRAWHDLGTYLHLLDPALPLDPLYAPPPA